ncbi:phosphoenolpyruvate synthase [Desulfovibrio sp. OttesenSCG-928-A18]|nr:phosphoenolpyruvate synthase [Desulfovibrio sp. OttesenSCG-928-A18]
MAWATLIDRLFAGRAAQKTHSDKSVVKNFRKRYARFRKLLDANAALGDIMAEIELKLGGKSLFGQLYVHRTALKAIELTRRMAVSLSAMHAGRYAGLSQAVNRIAEKLQRVIGEEVSCDVACQSLTLDLRQIDASMVDWVGGKCANLGEMQSMAGIPVPRGFAVTITAFQRFITHQGLDKELNALLAGIDSEDRDGLSAILDSIRARIEAAPLPPELEERFAVALNHSFNGENVRLAVRSSAQAEDGAKSFAGQFLTELNVRQEDFSDSYRRVIASLFTPSATLYRMHQGIPLSASAMAVACLEMVDARSSGVAYSHDPVNLLQDTLLINGVWGLGRYAVDGIVDPDLWVFTREEKPDLARRRRGSKDRRLVFGPDGELMDQPVPEEEQRSFSLTEQEAQALAALVMQLEKHYGGYQDIEWAQTRDGRLIFLQSRPLDTHFGNANAPKPPLLTTRPLLLEGGDTAYPGVGHGLVVRPETAEDLLHFPQDGILVAAHSNAEYATVMDRAQAVITETGGITGHMATICREFRVPTILNAKGAMARLDKGQEVTVDAFSCRVYDGKVEELLPLRLSLDPVRLQDTPVHTMLRDAARYILPLNLTDPSSGRFTPENCQTLHDVMRYAHEHSYQEMFAISDNASDAGGVAMKLKAPLPIDLYIIDLDRGTRTSAEARAVTPEEILCAPLKALLKGMLRPDVMFRRPRPISMGGFISVMGQQMGNPQGGDGRFGDKSYAIISDRYMNFSSRVGYHYSILDSYCGQTMSKNYISFSFQGGAAGEVRRVRRIKAISLVLKELGFSVNVQGDTVKSRFQKYPAPDIEERLDQLGRLLQVTRQMDMLMVNDEAIVQFRDDFMNGIYH